MTARSGPIKPPEEEDYFSFIEDGGSEPEEAFDPVTEVLLPTCQKARQLPWPDRVPILAAADISLDQNERGARKPLWRWVMETFPLGDSLDSAERLIHDVFKNAIRLPGDCNFMSTRTYTAEEQAAAWNAALRSVGYDIPEDGKRKRGRKR
jgi:hypothetical protein